ncbi:hypothetical protein Nepgr_020374 [Nepenthes gracilis]|uniref:Uncharacterized protein n=1 Tax=Nepenthes gracilis TaxID=150966 RepID=A0AAD3SVX3_NEPGR|nr:hypothetical protein Nepgr_020374 [Nepenthes gracilis]
MAADIQTKSQVLIQEAVQQTLAWKTTALPPQELYTPCQQPAPASPEDRQISIATSTNHVKPASRRKMKLSSQRIPLGSVQTEHLHNKKESATTSKAD